MGSTSNFLVESYADAHELADLLIRQLRGMRIDIRNKGAATDLERSIDFAAYDLFERSKPVGHFEFRLRPEGYRVSLDLSGVDEPRCNAILDAARSKYPEYFAVPSN